MAHGHDSFLPPEMDGSPFPEMKFCKKRRFPSKKRAVESPDKEFADKSPAELDRVPKFRYNEH
jgi:hypothetical protein